MRIALPTTGGELATHFGHCDEFVLFDIDHETNEISGRRTVTAPPHQPGLLPAWLSEQGVSLVLAGGMGARALTLFADHGIGVSVGMPAGSPDELVVEYLAGRLKSGSNICDH